MEPPFAYKIHKVSDERYDFEYAGYLGEHDVEIVTRQEQLLAKITGRVGLCYDVSQMTGFHRSQVSRHGNLFLGHRAKIDGLALFGARPAIRFGAITVSLLARLPLKVFDTRDEAGAWLVAMRKAKKGD